MDIWDVPVVCYYKQAAMNILYIPHSTRGNSPDPLPSPGLGSNEQRNIGQVLYILCLL